jgi:hypothetical protein
MPKMPRHIVVRPVGARLALAVCGGILLSACAARYAQVPARLNLAPYGRVAIVTFYSDQSQAPIGTLATQRFAEALLANQNGVEVLELGASDSSLKALATTADGSELAQALGREKNVPAVFVGSLKVSRVKPSGRLSTSGVNVRTSVSAELTVRLLSTSTGGTVWRANAATNETVGRLAISDGLPAVSVRDQDAVYGEMVRELVASVTRDLRPTWVKQ